MPTTFGHAPRSNSHCHSAASTIATATRARGLLLRRRRDLATAPRMPHSTAALPTQGRRVTADRAASFFCTRAGTTVAISWASPRRVWRSTPKWVSRAASSSSSISWASFVVVPCSALRSSRQGSGPSSAESSAESPTVACMNRARKRRWSPTLMPGSRRRRHAVTSGISDGGAAARGRLAPPYRSCSGAGSMPTQPCRWYSAGASGPASRAASCLSASMFSSQVIRENTSSIPPIVFMDWRCILSKWEARGL
mmetsp:Transcript_30950/g.67936  ORF Transcript_30950/g.67936 Transcript_30950/m.67936 type:complete len:253 (+) Transcript_30950:118-876(+)